MTNPSFNPEEYYLPEDIDNNEDDSSEDYPLGGNIERHDIEVEKKLVFGDEEVEKQCRQAIKMWFKTLILN